MGAAPRSTVLGGTRHRNRLLAGVALLAVYTAVTAAVPALRMSVASADLRVVIEVARMCASLFAAVALALPGDEDATPERNAFVVALGVLGISDAVFGIFPLLVDGERELTGLAFYPWLTARYAAGLLFICAGLQRPRLSLRGYVLAAGAALVLADAVVVLLRDALPLPLEPPAGGGGMAVRVAGLEQAIVVAVVPGLLFALGAVLAWRLLVRSASVIYLWLCAALAVQAFAQTHELLYPVLRGPMVTTADALRTLVLLLLLCGAVLQVRNVYADRVAAVRGQAEDLRLQGEVLSALRHAAEREEDFRAIVVHELSTPLATLRAYAHVLDGSGAAGSSPAARRAVTGIAAESRRLTELVNRMEELRDLELDEFLCELRPIRMLPLLHDAARFVQGLPGSHRAVVSGEDLRVDADPVRLGQALRNVLTNAARYSPDRTPIVLDSGRGPGGSVRITVTDRGPGVPPDERRRVVRKYARGTTGRGAEGTGLGLYVAARITEAHGGRLLITDGPGGSGASVILELGKPS